MDWIRQRAWDKLCTMPVKAVKKKPAVKKSPSAAKVKPSAVKTMSLPRGKAIQAGRFRSFVDRTQVVTHLTIAASAIAVLLVLSSFDPVTFSTMPGKAETSHATQIGLEYDAPMKVEMLFARKNGAGYLSISNPTSRPLNISVPDSWRRTEVRGAPLTDFTSQPPEFGFRRWTMPAETGMSMILPTVPDDILFMSPSEPTAAITVRSVDVLSGEQFINVVLLNKQVETALWQE